jgi:formylglycine-generating enzyme required for sulfatase activity
VWVRLELVENTAEGPAYDRCKIEGILLDRNASRWRVFYGEARAGADAGWQAMRPRSGCAAVASEPSPGPWTLRGSPYLVVDVALEASATSEREVTLEASLTLRRLTGFAKAGAPTYEERTENRTLRVPAESSAVVPVLVASQKEIDEFRVRELLLRFRAIDSDSRPQAEYSEIAVAADVPRANIFLDGGFVGRTSSEGPVVLGTVRTGEREVAVRDPSGREARTVVQVEKGSRADVSLTLLPQSAESQPDGLRALGHNAQGSEEFWREKDGALVVRIPGGEFQMGSAEGEGEPAEHPQHAVRLKSFLIDKTEVTWGQYRRFVTQTSRPLPKPPIWGMPETFPVSNVTWDDAHAFCAWAGGRLPTEAEWERAARGDDARQYPWGNTFDPWRCNTRDGGPHAPTPAATYPDCVSPYGVLDLAGSVWEWCQDWYDAAYYANSPVENPTGPETARLRVMRGGAWMSPNSWTRSTVRQGIEPGWPGPMHGFRCAQDDQGETSK